VPFYKAGWSAFPIFAGVSDQTEGRNPVWIAALIIGCDL
jgi:hypothetical protein